MAKITFFMTRFRQADEKGLPSNRFLVASAKITLHDEKINLSTIEKCFPVSDFKPNCNINGNTLRIDPSFVNVGRSMQDVFIEHYTIEIDENGGITGTVTEARKVAIEYCYPVYTDAVENCLNILQKNHMIDAKMKHLIQQQIRSPDKSLQVIPDHPIFSPLKELSSRRNMDPSKVEPGSWWLEPGWEHTMSFLYITPRGKINSVPFPKFVGSVQGAHLGDLTIWGEAEQQVEGDVESKFEE